MALDFRPLALLAAGISALLLGADLAPEADAGALLDRLAKASEPRVIAWRRDIHQHPELSNREFRTAGVVAEHLESLGLTVRRGVAHTGVVAVLEDQRPGGTLALRADMDALPVTEEVDLPFASRARATYRGRDVGVMHACGHDVHTAILMGVAEVLRGAREWLPGRVVFLFQPAEEGAPPGEKGGARLMIAEGALSNPRPDAILGLHVVPQHVAGQIAYRSGAAMASSDRLEIRVVGRQTHAAYPWLGVDPIATAARIVLALQAIPGRQMDARIPSIVSIGSVHGGVRHNIIPDRVDLSGTIRALDPQLQRRLHQRVRETAEQIAASAGARAEVDIRVGYPVTYNDPGLTRRLLPTLHRVAGERNVIEALPRTGAEDFSFFQQEVPGVYLWLGIRPPDVPEAELEPNHSPRFFVDEAALELGVRALSHLALDFLSGA